MIKWYEGIHKNGHRFQWFINARRKTQLRRLHVCLLRVLSCIGIFRILFGRRGCIPGYWGYWNTLRGGGGALPWKNCMNKIRLAMILTLKWKFRFLARNINMYTLTTFQPLFIVKIIQILLSIKTYNIIYFTSIFATKCL